MDAMKMILEFLVVQMNPIFGHCALEYQRQVVVLPNAQTLYGFLMMSDPNENCSPEQNPSNTSDSASTPHSATDAPPPAQQDAQPSSSDGTIPGATAGTAASAGTAPHRFSPVPPVSNALPASQNQNQWAMWVHVSTLSQWLGVPFGGLIGPLILWLMKKETMPAVDYHGKEALNFRRSYCRKLWIGAGGSVRLQRDYSGEWCACRGPILTSP